TTGPQPEWLAWVAEASGGVKWSARPTHWVRASSTARPRRWIWQQRSTIRWVFRCTPGIAQRTAGRSSWGLKESRSTNWGVEANAKRLQESPRPVRHQGGFGESRRGLFLLPRGSNASNRK